MNDTAEQNCGPAADRNLDDRHPAAALTNEKFMRRHVRHVSVSVDTWLGPGARPAFRRGGCTPSILSLSPFHRLN